MKAAVVTAFDTPPAYTDFEDPTPNDGEQLVQVRAAGLHQIVRSIANGTHYLAKAVFPFIPGIDGVGTLPGGERVYFGGPRFPYGTFCPQTVIGSFMIVPLPGVIEDAVAAGIANPAMSSWLALDRAAFQSGETVLILGATGTSGLLAVQIAKARGARRVIAAGRNPEALARAQALGADATVSLTLPPDDLRTAFREAISDQGVDIVLDYLWGSPAEALLAALSTRGIISPGRRVRFVQIGNLAGSRIALDAHTLRSADIALLGSGFGSGSLDGIRQTLTNFFASYARHPFEFSHQLVPLAEIATHWNTPDASKRIVFQP